MHFCGQRCNFVGQRKFIDGPLPRRARRLEAAVHIRLGLCRPAQAAAVAAGQRQRRARRLEAAFRNRAGRGPAPASAGRGHGRGAAASAGTRLEAAVLNQAGLRWPAPASAVAAEPPRRRATWPLILRRPNSIPRSPNNDSTRSQCSKSEFALPPPDPPGHWHAVAGSSCSSSVHSDVTVAQA